jgi:AcrR family transcriptional regulator
MCHNGDMTAIGGLRERKKARTREALLDAAMELFSHRGFDGTTIEDIAEACEVSPRTFFRYFPAKEAVLFGDSAGRCTALIGALADQPADARPLDALHAAMRAIARDYRNDRELLLARSRVVQGSPQLRAYKAEHQRGWEDAVIEELSRRARASHGELSSLELRLVAGVSIASLRAALDVWLDDPRAPALEVLVDRVFAYLSEGLGSLGA